MRAEQSLPQHPELRGSVRLGAGGTTVIIEGGRDWRMSDRFFAAVPSAAVLWWKPDQGARRLIAERPGAEASATASFGQVNADVAAALHGHVVERARAYAPAVVVDAYAGTGETAVPLAVSGVRVTAIELDRDAVARCASRMPKSSQAIAGRVEDVLPSALPADVVMLNPPRAGLHERVPEILTRQVPRPRAILYVSCNPATLARDLTRLAAYRIASVVCFDMFPQTAHVETVCELVPEAS
jgi:23S rRNA (uracil1939-C5)-methyltransferase